MGSPDYDSRYEEAERRQDELIQGFLDDGILAVKAFNSCAGMVSKVEEATKVTEAFRGVLAIMRPDDSDYELPKRESILPDTLPEWLYQRFARHGSNASSWEQLGDDDREYWRHEALAVARAVGRGGFKSITEQQSSKKYPNAAFDDLPLEQ